MDHDVLVLADPEEIAEAAAEILVAAAQAAVETDGRFVLGLSTGPETPAVLRQLARPDRIDRVDWERTWIVPTDARCGPDGSAAGLDGALLDPLPVPPAQIVRIDRDVPQATRAAYFHEERLREMFPDRDWPALDLVLLGLGPDGETAALYPDTDALAVNDRWVAANYLADRGAWYVTLTLPALCAAGQILFLVAGPDGTAPVRSAFVEDRSIVPVLPASHIVPVNGSRLVLVDEIAGASLIDRG